MGAFAGGGWVASIFSFPLCLSGDAECCRSCCCWPVGAHDNIKEVCQVAHDLVPCCQSSLGPVTGHTSEKILPTVCCCSPGFQEQHDHWQLQYAALSGCQAVSGHGMPNTKRCTHKMRYALETITARGLGKGRTWGVKRAPGVRRCQGNHLGGVPSAAGGAV